LKRGRGPQIRTEGDASARRKNCRRVAFLIDGDVYFSDGCRWPTVYYAQESRVYLSCPAERFTSDSQNGCCFFIPFEKAVVKNNGPGPLASEEWARAYIDTNAARCVLGIRKIMKISSQLMFAENVL
jgi:hypothetical protein